MANAPRQITLPNDEDETQGSGSVAIAPSMAPAASTPGVTAPEGTKENPHKDQSNVAPSHARDFALKIEEAKKFGNDDGKGKKAFVAFARSLVDGGTERVLTTEKKEDHARKMYRAFADSSVAASRKDSPGAVYGEENKLSEDVQISKVKAFIRFGNNFKDTALVTFDKARKLHAELVGRGENLKYRSTYSALVKIAVDQCKKVPHPTDPDKKVARETLTDDEIRDILVAPEVEVKEVTGVDMLVNAMNVIKHAIDGRPTTENRPGREAITHADLPTVLANLTSIIGEVAGGPEALAAHNAKLQEIADRKAEAAKKKADKEAEAAKKKAEKEAEAAKGSTETGEGDETMSQEDLIPEELTDQLEMDDAE